MLLSTHQNPFKRRYHTDSDADAHAVRLFIERRANSLRRSKTVSGNMHQTSFSRSLQSSEVMAKLGPKPLLVQVEFEVFGTVSGVFFTKYAREMCEKLNLKGWVRLSRRGTVYGQIQGEKERVDEMALWLRLQGSPGARIEHCEFKNWQIIDSCNFRNFSVRF